MTAEEELRAAHTVERRGRAGAGAGPFIEPFAAPRDFGDPNLFGFVKSIDQKDLSKLRLLIDTALPPENGFVVVQESFPHPSHSGKSRSEFQALIGGIDTETGDLIG